MGKRRTKDQWATLVKDFRASGLSLGAWCRNNGISKSSIYPYLNKNQQEVNMSKQEWGKVTIANPIEEQPIVLKVRNITLDIKSGFNKETLSDILTGE